MSRSFSIAYESETDPNTNLPFGTRNGRNITLTTPLQLDSRVRKGYRIVSFALSAVIPNVYTYQGTNTQTFRLSKDGGTSWTDCSLKVGRYSIRNIQDSINNIANQLSYYTSTSDPAFILSYNPATKFVYCSIDSTKMVGGVQFGIDFSVSNLCEMLGFQAQKTFITDNLFTADDIPQIDWQGTSVNINTSFISKSMNVNGKWVNTLVNIPITNESANVEIYYPSASTFSYSPLIEADVSNYISNYDINLRTNKGKELVVIYGRFRIDIEVVINI